MAPGLSIPLTKTANTLRFEARFNFLYKLVVFGLPALSVFLVVWGEHNNNDNATVAGIFLPFAWILLLGVVLYNWRRCKKRLRDFVGDETPALRMDEAGITVPLLIFDGHDTFKKARAARGEKYINFAWPEIRSWTVYSDNSSMTQQIQGGPVIQYRLLVQTPEFAGEARLDRPFTFDEELQLMAFVESMLPFPIQKVKL